MLAMPRPVFAMLRPTRVVQTPPKNNLFTPDKEPKKDQSTYRTRVQLCKLMSLIVITYINMSKGLQEQKHLKDSCCNHQILPPNERQLKKLETWRTMYILQAAQQIVLSRWLYWSKPFGKLSCFLLLPGSWFTLGVLFAALFLWQSSLQLSLSESDSKQSLLYTPGLNWIW